MTNLDIRISTYSLLNYSESLRSTEDEETLFLIVESFSYYILNLYGSLIEEAMYSSRYKGDWEPIDDEGYREYLGTEPTVPILYLIKDALEVKKVGPNFIVRIDPRYRYPKSNLTLLRVLRAIESGTSDFNARPILTKVVRNLKSNMLKLWRGYLKMKGVV